MAGKRNVDMLPAGFRNIPLLELHRAIEARLPQLYAVLCDQASFIEWRVKIRDDGSAYALVKRAGEDGTPLVTFGSGYDALSALDGLEGAITAGNWRVDKPYTNGGSGSDNGRSGGGAS